ncbi:MAG: DNA polymerase III subunit delta' [Candidatus Berkelbacteria bacterium Athens1014_28]|uniref:DNA polymerase III subunit delta n=1 Tax=Candidatus Berkelbacteria bacterium Athens1014_28 TaxID=2017145 RepID=A0A554LJ55_9BACT|nr:MAG: DNA polymerase III subunit delta' [Candidatus Berkelbacteria bacterium Athens1014_28]
MDKSKIKPELGKSYIFFGSDVEKSRKVVIAMSEKLEISKFDIIEIAPDENKENSKGEISISTVREAISKISTTAGYGRGKMLIVKNADRLGIAAANALLKTLEEPSKNTIICLLSADNDLIPTIVSRCQIIRVFDCVVKSKNAFVPRGGTIKELFFLADNLSKLENPEAEIDGIIAHLRNELIADSSKQNLSRLKMAFSAKRNLRITTNKKLVLENLMIGLS